METTTTTAYDELKQYVRDVKRGVVCYLGPIFIVDGELHTSSVPPPEEIDIPFSNHIHRQNGMHTVPALHRVIQEAERGWLDQWTYDNAVVITPCSCVCCTAKRIKLTELAQA